MGVIQPGDPQPELQAFANDPGPASVSGSNGPPNPPEANQVKTAVDPWSDELAKSIVITDFNRTQSHRTKNFEMRWDTNENLYHANVPQRTWDGSDTPRSSIGVRLTWQQLESLLPRVMEAMFNSVDGIWFDVFPLPGTDPLQAIATRELQAHQLDEGGFRSAFRRAAKCAGQHGNGYLKMVWNRYSKERQVWEDQLVPETTNIRGMQVSTGRMKRKFSRTKYTERINRPEWKYVPLRDFYIDPAHKAPQVQGAKFVIQRGFFGIEELLDLAEDDKSYKGMPSREVLIDRARKKIGPAKADADQHKQQAALEAGIFQGHPVVGTSDPAKYPFEVLEYWTEDRLVTVLDREFVVRNIPNPYQFIPYFSVVFTDVLDEHYGKGLAEILEGEQRIQQGIINARLDELALNIHGQLVYQEGMVIGKHQLRPRPGGAIAVTGDVNTAVKRLERQEMTASAFAEVQQSQLRAQQYTGVTDIVVQGAPAVNTSATRTKFGIGTIAQAAFSRIQYFVDNIATDTIIPMLNHQYDLNCRYLDPSTPITILGPSLGKTVQINPMEVANGSYKFEMRAASRMGAKQAMQQSLPFMLQTLLNPEVLAGLSEQNQTLNFSAIFRDTFDVMGWRSKSDWIRPMTPQEIQMRQQQSQMTTEMLRLQKAQMQTQAKAQMQGQQQDMDMLQLIVGKILDQSPGAAPMALAKALQASNG